MVNIRIGAKIAAKRREKGVTQEELASFLGVSKPAVSKWESDQSYPDITLLPEIAAYFDLTVDDLLGYEPQMSKDDVRKMYAELCKAFASERFEAAYVKCREYAKKYYSCWSVQFHVGLLYVNHASLAGERMQDVINEAIKLFERVTNEGSDANLARQAVCLQSYCHLILNQPVNAIDLLENVEEPLLDRRPLLIKAYQMKGDLKKARSILQGYIYTLLTGVIGAIPDFMGAYADDRAKAKEGLEKMIGMGGVFELESMHPAIYLSAYLAAAQVFAAQGSREDALKMLEKYVRVLKSPGLFPLKLRGSAFFDSLENYFDSFGLGTYPPRSDEVIKQSAKDAVLRNPGFEPLKDEPRFLQLSEKLNEI